MRSGGGLFWRCWCTFCSFYHSLLSAASSLLWSVPAFCAVSFGVYPTKRPRFIWGAHGVGPSWMQYVGRVLRVLQFSAWLNGDQRHARFGIAAINHAVNLFGRNILSLAPPDVSIRWLPQGSGKIIRSWPQAGGQGEHRCITSLHRGRQPLFDKALAMQAGAWWLFHPHAAPKSGVDISSAALISSS